MKDDDSIMIYYMILLW